MHEARLALAMHPRCGANCRTTNLTCKNPSMKNGRCRMHGGKSTGRPIITGINTRLFKDLMSESKAMLNLLNRFV